VQWWEEKKRCSREGEEGTENRPKEDHVKPQDPSCLRPRSKDGEVGGEINLKKKRGQELEQKGNVLAFQDTPKQHPGSRDNATASPNLVVKSNSGGRVKGGQGEGVVPQVAGREECSIGGAKKVAVEERFRGNAGPYLGKWVDASDRTRIFG